MKRTRPPIAPLFHELLTLQHYLGEKASSLEVVVAVITEEVSLRQMIERRSPRQPAPPVELLRFAAKGLAKDRNARFQSAEEMIEALESIMETRATIGRRLSSAQRSLRGMRTLVAAPLHRAFYSALASRVRVALADATEPAALSVQGS